MGKPARAVNGKHGFLHSANWIVACVAAVVLLLIPVAIGQTGTGSLRGLLVAAGVCLFSSLAAEVLTWSVWRPQVPGSSLTALLLGMGARLMPPLAACAMLALRGQSGHQHLAFVWYLLAFYLVTLTTETVLAVRRLSIAPAKFNSSTS